MNNKKRGLGRSLNDLGLDQLLSRGPSVAEDNNVSEKLTQLPLNVVQAGQWQPRRDFDPEALQELADSIRSQGIIQPIVVRKLHETNTYEIIAGERRFRAAKLAGLTEVPVVIKDIPDESAVAMALIENIQREDLNVIEEARALQRLLDEFELTHQQVAQIVGKSRTTVTNLLRLLSLPETVTMMLEHGDLEMGHARALLTLTELQQMQVAQQVVDKNLTVRETEEYIRRLNKAQVHKSSEQTPKPEILALEEHIAGFLDTGVKLSQNQRGRGKLVIEFRSAQDRDRIFDLIGMKKDGHTG